MTTKDFIFANVKALESSDDSPNGSFEATISAPSIDRDGEVIDAGAFDPLPASIPILADHLGEVRSLVGRAVPYYEGETLKAKGSFASHEFAQYVRGLLTEAMLDTMSVGFMPPKRTIIEGTPHITKSELLEASFVVIPSNRDALVNTAKAMAPEKQYVDVEPPDGSYEDTQDDLRSALSDLYGANSQVTLVATYPDHVVYEVDSATYTVGFVIDTDGEVTLGEPEAVEITQLVTPKTASRLELKVGRRNSNRDQDHIQAAHDALVLAGATCDTSAQGDPGAETDDEAKALGLAGFITATEKMLDDMATDAVNTSSHLSSGTD